jgi:AcrR family transcriptional regulator
MDKRTEILASAARTFETQGLRGVGIDQVLAPSGASTRTLYKHFGSRDGLVIAVLEDRHQQFMAQLASERADGEAIASLFDTLAHWVNARGASGCMLLRARSEYAQANEAIVTLVQQQKAQFHAEIAARVHTDLGREEAALALQVWMLFEGATAAATVAGPAVIDQARQAALTLMACAKAARS